MMQVIYKLPTRKFSRNCNLPAKRGAALITALLLISILLTLGLARAFFIEQEYLAANRENLKAQAYYLALSGLHYYRETRNFQITPEGKVVPQEVPEGDKTHFFVVYPGPNVFSHGYILNAAGKVIAERTLVMPDSEYEEFYDAKE